MDDNTTIITDQPIVNIVPQIDTPVVNQEAKTEDISTDVDNTVDNLLTVSDSEKQINNSTDKPWLFQKGQSGNPNGRPKKDWTWAGLLEEVAEEYTQVKTTDGKIIREKYKKLVATRLFKEAINGNVGAAKEIGNRMDGMPKQTVEQTGEINLNVNDMLKKIYGDSGSESTE